MENEVLIIDDRVQFCESLAENLEHMGYRGRYAVNRREALRQFAGNRRIRAVLLDIVLGDEDGIDVLRELQAIDRRVPVIMITGFASIQTAVRSIKLGAFDYVQKPIQIEVLSKVIDNAIASASERAASERAASERPAPGPAESRTLWEGREEPAPGLVTRNPAMLGLLDRARRIAANDLSILICGENGTGKELIADFIHAASPRRSRKMVKINCAAFPESLLDNELFGHEKDAYTGASSSFKGVFERASGGSLFLDEIADMLPAIQAKILRALQNSEIRRIGGDETIRIDVRFIAATNRDLPALIAERKFREDLFYRLNASTLHVPPLRERKEDIPPLVERFLLESGRSGSRKIRGVSEEVLARFLSHPWPGNVRELKNTVFYAAAMAAADTVEVCDLPPGLTSAGGEAFSRPDRSQSIEEHEKCLILATLHRTGYNKAKAAQLLSISRNTLYNKLKKYGISV